MSVATQLVVHFVLFIHCFGQVVQEPQFCVTHSDIKKLERLFTEEDDTDLGYYWQAVQQKAFGDDTYNQILYVENYYDTNVWSFARVDSQENVCSGILLIYY